MPDLQVDTRTLDTVVRAASDAAEQLRSRTPCRSDDVFGAPAVEAVWLATAGARERMVDALADTIAAVGALAAETARTIPAQDAALAQAAS